jgi:NADH-quinone oxidoreductase subunit E
MSGLLSPALAARIAALAARYPQPPAALLPSLHLVQAEIGWIPAQAEEEVAGLLGLPPIRVREAITFYSLFRRRPAGRHHIRICRSLSCSLGGSEALLERLGTRLGIRPGETTSDGRFSLEEVECLGRCDKGPCGLIDLEEHPRLTPEALDKILEGLD